MGFESSFQIWSVGINYYYDYLYGNGPESVEINFINVVESAKNPDSFLEHMDGTETSTGEVTLLTAIRLAPYFAKAESIIPISFGVDTETLIGGKMSSYILMIKVDGEQDFAVLLDENKKIMTIFPDNPNWVWDNYMVAN